MYVNLRTKKSNKGYRFEDFVIRLMVNNRKYQKYKKTLETVLLEFAYQNNQTLVPMDKVINNSTAYKLIRDLTADKHALDTLAQHGLHLSASIKQIGGPLDYEASVRLSTATLIGNCRIGAFTYIGGGSEVRRASIGRFCSIAANVAIGPAEHPLNWLSSHPFVCDGFRYIDSDDNYKSFANPKLRFRGNSATTEIGNDVWIGRNVIIKQGIKVGNGAVIAGGSFVNKDVADYAIMAGVPARLIRYRFDFEKIQLLNRIGWWNLNLDSVKNSIDFSDIEKSIDRIQTLLEKGEISKFDPINYYLVEGVLKIKSFKNNSIK